MAHLFESSLFVDEAREAFWFPLNSQRRQDELYSNSQTARVKRVVFSPHIFNLRLAKRRSCECRNRPLVFYSGQVGVPEHNLYKTPAPSWDTPHDRPHQNRNSREGLFIELPCKHIHASRGRFFSADAKAAKKEIREAKSEWLRAWSLRTHSFSQDPCSHHRC